MAESQEGADAAVDAEDVAHSVAGALPLGKWPRPGRAAA